jgi:putative ABC transport system permease protein
MFGRIVKESFLRRRGRKMIAISAVALGAAVATAMIAVAVGIGDKVNRELRSYGANIEALPRDRSVTVTASGISYQAAAGNGYINEQDLPNLRAIFWTNNILAFAPFLTVPVKCGLGVQPNGASMIDAPMSGTWFNHTVETPEIKPFVTGVEKVSPWWKVNGGWPKDGQCLIGSKLQVALKCSPGDQIAVRYTRPDGSQSDTSLIVSGVLSTGSDEDGSIVAPLAFVQHLSGLASRVDRVEVSALTNPEDDFGRRDPSTLKPEEYERWSCTPYPHSVALDIQKALPGSEAHPVLRVSNTEGALLSRVNAMLILVAIVALVAAIVGVTSTMMTTVLERKSEIGLLKAIGASNLGVTAIFLAESSIIGLLGGVAGLVLGSAMAQVISRTVFGSTIGISGVLVPIVIGLSVAVAFAGSAIPLKTALRFEPAIVLKGE